MSEWNDREVIANLFQLKKGKPVPPEIQEDMKLAIVTEFVMFLLNARTVIEDDAQTFNLWVLYDGANSVVVNTVMKNVCDFSLKVAHKSALAVVTGKMELLGIGDSAIKMIINTLFRNRDHFDELARHFGETNGIEGVVKLLMGMSGIAAWEKYRKE